MAELFAEEVAPMPAIPMTAAEVLDQYFLEVRCKLLEVAATLDRIDRAAENAPLGNDRRRQSIAKAIEALNEPSPDRAERLQLLFSIDYDPHWIDQLDQWKART